MPPNEPLVVAANRALADPAIRDVVREMHEAGAPLLQMVEALGLDDEMSARVGDIVSQLSPEVVTGIRQATVAMLNAGGTALPLDCSVSQAQLDAGTPVNVDIPTEDGVAKIRIQPATAQ